MASSSDSRAGLLLFVPAADRYLGHQGSPALEGHRHALVHLERHGQSCERRRQVAVVRREHGSAAGGYGERPRPLQGASPFLEPLDDLGRRVVSLRARSAPSRDRRRTGTSPALRSRRGDGPAMRARGDRERRTRCPATAPVRPARTARGAPRPRRRSACEPPSLPSRATSPPRPPPGAPRPAPTLPACSPVPGRERRSCGDGRATPPNPRRGTRPIRAPRAGGRSHRRPPNRPLRRGARCTPSGSHRSRPFAPRGTRGGSSGGERRNAAPSTLRARAPVSSTLDRCPVPAIPASRPEP